jgi:DNA-directed RNA polymerase specialized sigma24 family protein
LSTLPGGTPTSSQGSVTHWLHLLQAGDHAAVRPLWERYFAQLVRRARAALRGKANLGADEEDVTLSAFDSFCRSAQQGRFPNLADRDDLWRLLVVFTARKASRLLRDAARHKRGGGKVQTEADLPDPTEASEERGLAQVVGREPTPEFAAQVAEQYQRLLDKLPEPGLRAIALWQMEGLTVDEIAAQAGRSPRTVARKLSLIRELWRQEDSHA